MKYPGHLTVLTLAATTLLASSPLGCTNNHKQWKDDAESRWQAIRSAALLDMAKQQFEAGALDTAEKTTYDAAAIDADNPDLHLLAGRIAIERGQLERAYRLFETAMALHVGDPEMPNQPSPRWADPYYYQGVVLQRWHQYDAALTAYQKAYEYDPSSAQRMLAVAEMYVQQDRVDDAIAMLEDKKYYFDQNAGCRAMLGHLYQLKAEHKLAVENFRQAVMLNPDNMRLHEVLASAQVEAGDYRDAATTLKMLLDKPEYTQRHDLKRRLAVCEAQLGRHDAAREIYIELTRADPTNVTDWIRLGEQSWKLDDLGATMIAANRVITLAPQNHDGYLLSGLVWQKRGRIEDALEMFDRAAELAPKDATPLILRGLSLQKADRNAAAAEAYTEALKRDPADKRAEALLAQVRSD